MHLRESTISNFPPGLPRNYPPVFLNYPLELKIIETPANDRFDLSPTTGGRHIFID